MKKFILSTVIIAFAISCLITSCSQDEDWGMDEYSTLAGQKMTRGEPSVLAIQICDSTIYHYDIFLKDSDTVSHKVEVSIRFIQDEVDLRVELSSYYLYHENICEQYAGLYTVDKVWLRKDDLWGNRYILCAEGMNPRNRICYGELERIVFIE